MYNSKGRQLPMWSNKRVYSIPVPTIKLNKQLISILNTVSFQLDFCQRIKIISQSSFICVFFKIYENR